ncbi:MAG: DUF5906 domain-containing protein [Vicinamibacterales bacterium]
MNGVPPHFATVQDAAACYIDQMHWSVVPLLPRGKECVKPDWRNVVFRANDFAPHDNIGIKSVNGLVVADDDFTPHHNAALVVECRNAFMPPTGAIYGRASKPGAKRLYHCPDKTTPTVLKGFKNKVVFELRVAHQDMAPPSVHPNGERTRWDVLIHPDDVARVALETKARYYSTARLIGEVWPVGGRHELRLAIAGVLLRTLRIPTDDARNILEWGCRLGGSDAGGVRDAANAIASTSRKLEKGVKTSGAATVKQLLFHDDIGKQFIAILRRWYGKERVIPPEIAELNKHYFIIGLGAQTVVGEEVAQKGWTDFVFRSFDDFKRKTIKQVVKTGEKDGAPVFKPLAKFWLEHRDGRQYNRLVYSPPGSGIHIGHNDLNGWQGFRVTPKAGDWSLTRKLLFDVMCQEDTERFEWWMDWMASLFQQPGRHGESSPVCVGPQGTGKTFVAKTVIADTFDGRHARVTTHTKQVLGDFNDILSGLCFLVLDEVGLTDQKDYNAMKGLITGDDIVINRKGLKIETEPSMLHVMFLSNHATPIKPAADDRRLAYFPFRDTYRNDTKFFGALTDELNHRGGRAAMLDELLKRPVDWDRLRIAPDSDVKQTAKRESWTVAQWFLYRQLREHRSDWDNAKDAASKDVRRVEKKEWVSAFEVYTQSLGRKDIPPDALTELRKVLKTTFPDGPNRWDYNRAISGTRDYWTLPTWNEFKRAFEVSVGCSVDDLDDETALRDDESPF